MRHQPHGKCRFGALMAVFRYLVGDVDAAIAFYTGNLGFTLEQQMGPAFAIVSRGELSLWLSGPQSSAARPMPDGRQPQPGGWNRFVVDVAQSVADAAGGGEPAESGAIEKVRSAIG